MKILLLIIIMVVAVTAYASAESSIVETVTTFNPDAFELPEGLAVSRHGDLYVGLLGGEIKKVTPDGQVSSFATLNPGEGFLLGLAFDQQNVLYAALASFNPETHGVWEIKEDGTAQRFAALGPQGLPNAIVVDRSGNLLVSDSVMGKIWKITPDGEVSVWAENDLLLGAEEGLPDSLPIGVNGMAFGKDQLLYVVNDDFGRLIRIPVTPDGSAGSIKVVLEDEGLEGADGIAFDKKNNIYVAVNQQDKLVRITPDEEIETLATAGLDYPASVAFGVGEESKVLYVTNLAFLRAQGLVEGTPNPSLVRLEVGVTGRPLP
jgi:sugar lactone lactonase YvrE